MCERFRSNSKRDCSGYLAHRFAVRLARPCGACLTKVPAELRFVLFSNQKAKTFKVLLSYSFYVLILNNLNGHTGCIQLDCSSCPMWPLKKQSIKLDTIKIYNNNSKCKYSVAKKY